MLSGNDFIIFSDSEISLIYNTLKIRKNKATYKELQELGVLDIIKYIENFLFKDENI